MEKMKMDFTNREVVFNTLVDWEYENGESILDGRFGSDIRVVTFLAWAVGAKYITPEKFDNWVEARNRGDHQADEINYILYDGDDDRVSSYAIVNSKDGEWNEDEFQEGYKILAHFVSDFTIYQDRLKKFLKERIW